MLSVIGGHICWHLHAEPQLSEFQYPRHFSKSPMNWKDQVICTGSNQPFEQCSSEFHQLGHNQVAIDEPDDEDHSDPPDSHWF